MKAFVTGATGFLGRHLCLDLIEQGWQVIGVGRNQEQGAWLEKHGVIFMPMDLTDASQISLKDLAVDAVFHCAALSSLWGKYDDFFLSNVEATETLAKACIEAKIRRFIHISTPSIYFEYSNKQQVCESDPLPNKFANHYAHTKYQAEQLLLNKYKQNLDISIIRPRGIFGEFDSAIMPRILKIAKQGKVPLLNNGQAVVDVTYVKNVSHALILLANADKKTYGEIYNISNQQPLAIKSLLQQMCGAVKVPFEYRAVPYPVADKYVLLLEKFYQWFTNKEPAITRYSLGLLAFDQVLSTEKAQMHFNYQVKYSIEEGIERYANWYK